MENEKALFKIEKFKNKLIDDHPKFFDDLNKALGDGDLNSVVIGISNDKHQMYFLDFKETTDDEKMDIFLELKEGFLQQGLDLFDRRKMSEKLLEKSYSEIKNLNKALSTFMDDGGFNE